MSRKEREDARDFCAVMGEAWFAFHDEIGSARDEVEAACKVITSGNQYFLATFYVVQVVSEWTRLTQEFSAEHGEPISKDSVLVALIDLADTFNDYARRQAS